MTSRGRRGAAPAAVARAPASNLSNTAVSADDTITLRVAAPPETIEVPDVSGQLEAQARATLQAAGFTNITRQDTEADPGDVPGTVKATMPRICPSHKTSKVVPNLALVRRFAACHIAR